MVTKIDPGPNLSPVVTKEGTLETFFIRIKKMYTHTKKEKQRDEREGGRVGGKERRLLSGIESSLRVSLGTHCSQILGVKI